MELSYEALEWRTPLPEQDQVLDLPPPLPFSVRSGPKQPWS
ncbi:MAG: hypothetical protein RML14_10360 [Meiothermus sp.]|nr:hypothetical protein [Meiothermus sp.]MDW8482249.1 hypothetical protein [Meiothermus sp.]